MRASVSSRPQGHPFGLPGCPRAPRPAHVLLIKAQPAPPPPSERGRDTGQGEEEAQGPAEVTLGGRFSISDGRESDSEAAGGS